MENENNKQQSPEINAQDKGQDVGRNDFVGKDIEDVRVESDQAPVIEAERRRPIKEFPNKWFLLISVTLGIMIVALGGYFYYENNMKEEEIVTDPIPTVEPVENSADSVVEANNMFAVDMYKFYKGEDDNIFFSPLSISSALAMTYEGARGETRTEMQQTMHFPSDIELLRDEYAAIYEDMNSSLSNYDLNLANALWGQDGLAFDQQFIFNVEKYYGGSLNKTDFLSDPESSREEINDWVENETNDKIKDLMPKGSINKDTRLVLTNAIYFKGEWVKQFSENNTFPADFTKLDASSVSTDLMSSTGDESEFDYYEEGDTQVLQMPYDGDEISMMVILPKRGDFRDFEKDLTAEKITEYQGALVNQRVDVYFPKFKLDTSFDLTKTLQAMGMPTAMSTGADFSGITQEADLLISKVIHKAFIEVNEEGTEAAAATGIAMELTSAIPDEDPTPIFRADHPFIYIIHNNETGNILFMGRMSDPSVEKSDLELPDTVSYDGDDSHIEVSRSTGLGSENIKLYRNGDILYTSELEGGVTVKRSTILMTEYQKIEDLIYQYDLNSLSQDGDWEATNSGDQYQVNVVDIGGSNSLNCYGSSCPEVINILYDEIDSLSASVFNRSCDSYVDCVDIKCSQDSSLLDVDTEQYPATCRAVGGSSERECSCVE